ncbi:MAG: NUDIX hydrolase N-terminal domain-containing protein [Acidimicrobiales bacterium]
MADTAEPTEQLIRWSQALSAIARTGMGFTESLYERERYEEILRVAADMAAEAHTRGGAKAEPQAPAGNSADADLGSHGLGDAAAEILSAWMAGVGRGVGGYVTPKVAVGAVVGNDQGEILLVQRSQSGRWLYPTGWADVGYSAAEVAAKEVEEETGYLVEPVRVIAVFDGLRLGFTRIPLYSIVFLCEVRGGHLRAHPLECRDAGWFARDRLPRPLAGRDRWTDIAFAAIEGHDGPAVFDAPRRPLWRADPANPQP